MKQLVFFFFFLCAIPSIAQVYNDAYWQVNDATTQVTELNVFDGDVNIHVGDPDQLAYELHTDVLEVDFTSTALSSHNFVGINFSLFEWEGSVPSYFTTDINGNPVSHKQCNGYSVDFSQPENRVITFEIQSNEDFELWVNILDIQGKDANADAPRTQIYATQGGVDTANEQKWQQVVLSWDSSVTGTAQNIGSLQDMWSSVWWDREHMIDLQQNPIYINVAHIVEVSFFVNPLNPTYGEHKNFFIRNFKIGNGNVPPNPDNLWLVDDQTTNVPFISVLAPTLQTSDNFITTNNNESLLETSRIHDMLRITSTKLQQETWGETRINLTYFDGETGNAFAYNELGYNLYHDTLKGYSVDFSNPENQMVTFQIQASHDLVLRMDLLDRIGRASNSEMLEVQIEQTRGGIDYYDEQKWHTITLAWNNTIVADAYITEISDFWQNSFWNKANPDVNQTAVALDLEAIIGLLVCVDPYNYGEVGLEKSIVLRNLVIGKFQEGVNISYNPDNWQVEDNTVSTSGVYGVEKLRIESLDPVYEITENDGYTQITYESNGWSDINFFTNTWAGASSEYFTTDIDGNPQEHKIAEGNSVDMSDVARRIVSVEIQTDDELELLLYLIDVAGKNSNKYLPQISILPTEGGVDLDDEQKWRTITFAWDFSIDADAVVPGMEDLYSNQWNYRSTESLGLGFSYPLDTSRIVGVGLYADPTLSFSGTKTVYIRNLTIGNPIFKPVSPIVISTKNAEIEIDMQDYFTGDSPLSFEAQLVFGSHVFIEQNGSLFTLVTNERCADFTDSIQFRITDADGTYSQIVPFTLRQQTLDAPELGVVTVDSTGTYLLVAWERPNVDYIESYTIYREGLTDVYQEVGQLPFADTSVFVDQTAFFNNRAYRYKLSYTDICGKESPKSSAHKSIHLQRNMENNQLLLRWTLYEGASVIGYRLMQGTSIADFMSVDEFSSDQTSYTVMNPGSYIYRVETIMQDTITPTLLKAESGPFSLAVSNIAEAETSIIEFSKNTVRVYAPESGVIAVESPNGVTKIVITSQNGVIVETRFYSEPNSNDMFHVKPGVYIVSCTNAGSLTTYSTQVIVQ